MEKQSFQDVVPPSPRSVRRIPLSSSRTSIPVRTEATPSRTTAPARRSLKTSSEQIPPPPLTRPPERRYVMPEQPQKGSKKKLFIGLGILVLIVLIVIFSSFLFSRVVVTIIPKSTAVKIDKTFSAIASSTAPALRYELATSSVTLSEVVAASKGSLVQTKAKGTITITNASQTTAQTLVATTRFETASGKIYRLDKEIVVPAARTVAGRTTPGTIEAAVTADQYGDSYNIRMSDAPGALTVPGFKGSARYTIFSARLSSDMTGGFSGVKNIIAPAVATEAEKRIQAKITETLMENILASVASSSILYDNSYVIEFERLADVSKGDTSTEMRYTGTILAPVFDYENLAAHVAESDIAKLGGLQAVSVEGARDLIFTPVSMRAAALRRNELISFNLKGSVAVVGKIALENLKNELKGIRLSESTPVFGRYSAISSADVATVPRWIRSFPESGSRIEIVIERP
jgi:hypothetical protein